MRFLKTNTAVRVTVGPFIDKADGLTPKGTLTVANLVGCISSDTDDGNGPNAFHFHPAASASDNDMVVLGGGTDGAGLWELELTAAQLNFVGRFMLSLTDKDQICPVFHEFMVLPAQVFNSMMGTDLLDVNTSQAAGTAWNSGGITSTTFANGAFVAANIATDAVTKLQAGLATSADVLAIGVAGGASIPADADASNAGGALSPTSGAMVGSETNTYTATSNVNGTYHVVTNNPYPSIVYEFDCGGGTSAVDMNWTGYVATTNARTISFAAWNYDTDDWEVLGTQVGQATTVNVVKNFKLYARHIGKVEDTTALGKVFIRLLGTTNNATEIHTDQIYVSYAVTSRSSGYANGAVWVTSTGTAASENFVNGTADNPCPWANALTIAASVGLTRFHILPGNTITLAADFKGKFIGGESYFLELEGQDLSGTTISRCERVTGIAHKSTQEFYIRDSELGEVTLDECDIYNCALSDVLTLGEATSYKLDNCFAINVSGYFPTIDFGSGVGSTGCCITHWAGVLTIANMKTGDILALDGTGDITLADTCTGGTVYISGNIRLTNSSSIDPGNIYQNGLMASDTINAAITAALDADDAIDGESLRRAIAIIAAAAAGKNGATQSIFMGLDGTTTRIVGTVADPLRVSVVYP